MRLIQLMHLEYQINNKIVGKKVLANAEMCNEVLRNNMGLGNIIKLGFLCEIKSRLVTCFDTHAKLAVIV